MLLDERPATTSTRETSATERSAAVEARALVAATVLFGLVLLANLILQAALPTTAAVVLGVAAGVVLGVAGGQRLTTTVSSGLIWWATCCAVTVIVLLMAETNQHTLSWALGLTAAAAALPVLHWGRLQVAAGTALSTVVSDATKAFTLPTTGVAAAAIGAGVALPLVGSYAPVIGDPDSAWFVTSTQHVQRNGFDLLKETQDVFIPHLTIGPLLAFRGYQAAIPFMILTVIGLSALVGYLGYRLTNRGAGALAAASTLLLIPAIPERADRLPMYAAAFFFGYGAGWLLHRAMAQPDKRWLPVAAGVGLVLSYESHGVGQIFVLVPFLLLMLHPWRQARRPFLITLGTMAVFSIPRLLVNLSVDGLSDLRTNYADFMVQDYLTIVNRDFWEHNNDTSPLGYVTNLPSMTEDALGSRTMLLLLVLPIVLAALRSGWSARIFVGVSAVVFLAALAINSPATFGRYLAPLAVGLALVVAVGVVAMLKGGGEARLIGRIVLSVLTAAALFQLVDSVSEKVEQRNQLIVGPAPEFAATIDDDRTVIGVRPHQILWTDPSVPTAYARTMTEEDWVTYLTWPDDDSVVEMMDRYDAGWVYVMPDSRLEVDYHTTWLEPTYGLSAEHVERINESDQFCLVKEVHGHLLYRRGECQPGDLRVRPEEFLMPFYGLTPEEAENGFDGFDDPEEIEGGPESDELDDPTGQLEEDADAAEL